MRPAKSIQLRAAGKDWTVEKDQLRQSIKPRGTMKGMILIPLRTLEKYQLTLLIGLVGPMKGKILQNAFKSIWEYCLSFGWLT